LPPIQTDAVKFPRRLFAARLPRVDDSPRNSPLGQVDDILKSQLDDLAPPSYVMPAVCVETMTFSSVRRGYPQRRLAGENIERGPRNFFVPAR
jgi:hypothetical protein